MFMRATHKNPVAGPTPEASANNIRLLPCYDVIPPLIPSYLPPLSGEKAWGLLPFLTAVIYWVPGMESALPS